MATATTFTAAGAKATKNTSLPKGVFDVEVKSHDLLHTVYIASSANARINSARTKTRGLVSGGGKKPWRQKGTGRARVGSIRSPIWRGGGITFGPTGEENYKKKINKSAQRTAIRQALSLKAADKRVVVIEDLKLDGTAKAARKVLDKLPVDGRLLIVVDTKTPEIERSTRNIPRLNVVNSSHLSTAKVLDADWLLISRAGLSQLKERLGAAS